MATRKHARLPAAPMSRIRAAPIERVARSPKRGDVFYDLPAWRTLVRRLIKLRGRRCEDCGTTHGETGEPIRIYGDHIVELQDGGAPFDGANVMLRCPKCHGRKTAQVRAERTARRYLPG